MHAGRGPDDRSRMFGTGTTQGFRGTFQGPHCLLFMGEAIRSTPLRKFRGRREERCLKSSRSSLIPPNTGNAPCRPGRRFREGVRPELAAKVEDMGKYDVIFHRQPQLVEHHCASGRVFPGKLRPFRQDGDSICDAWGRRHGALCGRGSEAVSQVHRSQGRRFCRGRNPDDEGRACQVGQ